VLMRAERAARRPQPGGPTAPDETMAEAMAA